MQVKTCLLTQNIICSVEDFIKNLLPHIGVMDDVRNTLGPFGRLNVVKTGDLGRQAIHDEVLDHEELTLAVTNADQCPH